MGKNGDDSNGPKPVLRGGRPWKSHGRALQRRAFGAVRPKARTLKDRVEAWIDANPKSTAGDVVEAFDEFSNASEYFAFRSGRLTLQPPRG